MMIYSGSNSLCNSLSNVFSHNTMRPNNIYLTLLRPLPLRHPRIPGGKPCT